MSRDKHPDALPASADPSGLSDLIGVSKQLTEAGIVHALGGTGLLFALGFQVCPRDWDLLTDAPVKRVAPALSGWTMEQAGPSADFPSDYLIRLQAHQSRIEIIGRFAIASGDGVLRIPTRVAGTFRGIPLGHPADWILAYRAIASLTPKDARGDADKIRLLKQALRSGFGFQGCQVIHSRGLR